MRSVPGHIDLAFLLLMVMVLASIIAGHYIGARRAGLQSPRRRTGLLTAGIIGWMILLAVLASAGVFAKFELIPPRLPMTLFIGMLTIFFLVTRPATKRLAQALPLHWPLVLQSFRIPLELILWALFLNNALPEQMTFSGYNFDVLSGVLGLVVGIGFYMNWFRSRSIILIYNIVGLALLMTIVSIAVLSFPTPFRVFMNEPSNTIVAYVPYVWLPGIYVLSAFFLHIFSFLQLAVKKENS